MINYTFVRFIPLLIPLFGYVTFASDSVPITGMYSNMVLNKESGDVLGSEMFIVYSNKGYFVTFQSSEGEPTIPVVTDLKVNGTHIEFSLPEGHAYNGTFKGDITYQDLTGSFERGQLDYTGEKVFRLKRKDSYWQGAVNGPWP